MESRFTVVVPSNYNEVYDLIANKPLSSWYSVIRNRTLLNTLLNEVSDNERLRFLALLDVKILPYFQNPFFNHQESIKSASEDTNDPMACLHLACAYVNCRADLLRL
jgi:hypothetical protein